MTEPEFASFDVRRRRLLYRATHRGTYENDILLGGFVQRYLAGFSESELTAVEALLDLPENELGDWLTGRLPIPDEIATPMLLRVRDAAAAAASVSFASVVRPGDVSWPGLARPPTTSFPVDGEDVVGRAKPGHDTRGERQCP